MRLLSGNSTSYNGMGGNVTLTAGSGVSLEGGSGGSVTFTGDLPIILTIYFNIPLTTKPSINR